MVFCHTFQCSFLYKLESSCDLKNLQYQLVFSGVTHSPSPVCLWGVFKSIKFKLPSKPLGNERFNCVRIVEGFKRKQWNYQHWSSSRRLAPAWRELGGHWRKTCRLRWGHFLLCSKCWPLLIWKKYICVKKYMCDRASFDLFQFANEPECNKSTLSKEESMCVSNKVTPHGAHQSLGGRHTVHAFSAWKSTSWWN